MRERSRERKKDNRKPFFLLIRENEIRFLREGWFVDLWHGLVWFRSWCFTTYTRPFRRDCMGSMRQTRLLCCFLSSLPRTSFPHYWYLEKKTPTRTRPRSTKRTMESKKSLKISGSALSRSRSESVRRICQCSLVSF